MDASLHSPPTGEVSLEADEIFCASPNEAVIESSCLFGSRKLDTTWLKYVCSTAQSRYLVGGALRTFH